MISAVTKDRRSSPRKRAKKPAHLDAVKERWSKIHKRHKLAAVMVKDSRPVSELIEEFLANGGQIKKVPQGCSGLSS